MELKKALKVIVLPISIAVGLGVVGSKVVKTKANNKKNKSEQTEKDTKKAIQDSKFKEELCKKQGHKLYKRLSATKLEIDSMYEGYTTYICMDCLHQVKGDDLLYDDMYKRLDTDTFKKIK